MNRKARRASDKQAKQAERRLSKKYVLRRAEPDEEGESMDLVAFLEKTRNEMQSVILKLDKAKSGVRPEDRIEASRIQAAMMIGVSLAFMDSFVGNPDDKMHIAETARAWSQKFKFVDKSGMVETPEDSVIIQPPRLVIPS